MAVGGPAMPTNKKDLGAKFLRGEDMLVKGTWREFTFTIAKTFAANSLRGEDGEVIDRPVIEFAEPKERKLFVVGEMNERFIRCETGIHDAADLIGKKMTLYAAAGNWFGQYTPALRIRITGNKVAPRVRPANLGKDLTGTKVEVAQ